jgi:hypothetical protein
MRGPKAAILDRDRSKWLSRWIMIWPKPTILDRVRSTRRGRSRGRRRARSTVHAAWGPCGAFCMALFKTSDRTLVAKAIREQHKNRSNIDLPQPPRIPTVCLQKSQTHGIKGSLGARMGEVPDLNDTVAKSPRNNTGGRRTLEDFARRTGPI